MTSPQTTSADGRPSDGYTPDPRRWKALTVCLIGGFMVLLDVSIVNVALPSIREGLGASESDIQWVVSGYALSFGLFLIPAGRLGDVRGRRVMFLAALSLFTVASVLCGAAQNSTWLVVARFVQGVGGGLLTPQISAFIQEQFRGSERGKAFGLFGMTVGISTAFGPLLGGLLITAFGQQSGWRWVFFVNVPIGVVALIMTRILLPPGSANAARKHNFDPVGVVLLGVGVVVLLLPFVQEQQWKGSLKWVLVPVAVLVLAGFLAWDILYKRRGKEPLVDLELFRSRSYSSGVAMIALYFAGFTPLFFIYTLLLQTGHGYSALLSGLASIPFAVGSGIAAPLGGRMVTRTGRPLIVLGLVLVVIGFVGLELAVHSASPHALGWATIAPLLVAGIGSGLVIAPNQALTLADVPVPQAGASGGLLQTGQRIGSAIGVAAAGSVFYSAIASSHGDFNSGFDKGLFVAGAFVLAALVVAVWDVVLDRRSHGRHEVGDGHRELDVRAKLGLAAYTD